MNKAVYIVGILLLVGFVVMGASEMVKSQTPYVTSIAQVKSMSDRPVQFIGNIAHSKTRYNEVSDELHFQLKDEKNQTLNVSYKGIKPGNFDSASKAVVRGRFQNNKFIADQLLIKCPSKYESKITL